MLTLKPKSTPKVEDLRSITNALFVVEHLLQPMFKSTTSIQSSDLEVLQHGMSLLKDSIAQLKIYKSCVEHAIKKKQKKRKQGEQNKKVK